MRMGSLVYEEIKEQLLDGMWPAGTRLSIEELKKTFDVSKQPVMEAMRRLASDGLVQVVPQVGCRVMSYSPDDIIDFFRLMAAFEGAMSAVAAERRTDADIEALKQAHQAIGSLCGSNDKPSRAYGYRRLNRDFHGAIHAITHSDLVMGTSARLWDLSDFLITTAGRPLTFEESLEHRHCEHEEILEAIVDGDGSKAREATERHVLGNLTAMPFSTGLP